MTAAISHGSAHAAYQRTGALADRDPSGASAGKASGGAFPAGGGENLSESERKQVSDLKKRDAEVRAHEQAHAAAGGAHAGSPSYEFQRGPDGKAYAVGGEVAIDTSAEGTPEATVRKMELVIRAALAPADPSPQDQRVAAAARQTRLAAQAEARKAREAEQSGEVGNEAAAALPDDAATPRDAIRAAIEAAEGILQGEDARNEGRQATLQRQGALAGVPDGDDRAHPGPGEPVISGAGVFLGFNEPAAKAGVRAGAAAADTPAGATREGPVDAASAGADAGLRLAAARAYGSTDPRSPF